ncbi:C6 zinc finger domain protein [Penicillium angulare]|uniref:C6 zinc finger domain protein n=1 Tax=Penicillium angulare TaxID=116970 RepID=UPI002541942C|nr:C6 zinc finger domain protein [Penicillium angulare]KAJ5263147.1 C6 zinc finger domain protein [Penicillium angulare]
MDSARSTRSTDRSRRGTSRKKTGCATCKSRHTRCDEKTPVCNNCERLGLQCRPSEFITQSTWSSILSTDPPPGEERETDSTSTFSKFLPSFSPQATRASSKGSASELSSSLTPSNQATVASQSSRSLSRPSSSGISVELNDEVITLLNTFRAGLATWMDVFDFDKTYEREVSRRALHSDFLLRCICAFTARNLSLLVSGEVWSPIASRYYGEALNYMIVALSCGEPDSDALTAAILLSSYEALAASRTSHQSHYKGAMSLIITRGISASSIGLDKANFFIYMRHEITIALSNQEPLQFDPKRWNITKPGARAWEDHLANYLMLLIGHIVNLIYKGIESPSDRTRLKDQVDEWYDTTTEEFRGIAYGEVSESGFQKIFFPVPASAAAILWFHAAQILLFAEGDTFSPSSSLSKIKVQEHAKSIINIASSELPASARCFAITPIYIAGKHIHERDWILYPRQDTIFGTNDASERLYSVPTAFAFHVEYIEKLFQTLIM